MASSGRPHRQYSTRLLSDWVPRSGGTLCPTAVDDAQPCRDRLYAWLHNTVTPVGRAALAPQVFNRRNSPSCPESPTWPIKAFPALASSRSCGSFPCMLARCILAVANIHVRSGTHTMPISSSCNPAFGSSTRHATTLPHVFLSTRRSSTGFAGCARPSVHGTPSECGKCTDELRARALLQLACQSSDALRSKGAGAGWAISYLIMIHIHHMIIS